MITCVYSSRARNCEILLKLRGDMEFMKHMYGYRVGDVILGDNGRSAGERTGRTGTVQKARSQISFGPAN